jgi:hypothetical protein
LQKIDRRIFENTGGYGRHQAIVKIVENLRKTGLVQCCRDLSFSLGNLTEIGRDFLAYNTIDKPKFVFDPAKLKTSTWQNGGLNTFGPFDANIFDKKDCKLAVIVPIQFDNEVQKFFSYFKDGDPGPGYYQEGFIKKYHLHSLRIDYIPFNCNLDDLSGSYKSACLTALNNGNYNLAIIIIEERFRDQPNDPYLIAKSLFMSQGIPVQEIEIETVRQTGRAYSLDNIALAIYAKLGGTPWTISSSNQASHELIIGLGSTSIKNSRLSPITRYIGITAVFGADGNYLFSNLSKEVEYEQYLDELTDSLKKVIAEVGKRNALAKGDNLRLVFHQAFKQYNENEVFSVKRAISEITDYKIDFSFVNIGQDHNYSIFDKNQHGVPISKYSTQVKGEMIPGKGYFIQDSYDSALVTITGPQQLLTPFQAFPKPLHITVHRDSTFNDIQYLSKQVYDFTFLSWRSFNPTHVPVTILYSNLIAGLLGRLRNVKNWNPDILYTNLKSSRWFL